MSKGLFQRFGVILRNTQALKWSYLQPTYLSSRSLTNGLLKSEENIFNFQRNTASILPSQNTMLSYGFCRSFSTSCSLSIKRGYKQENWSFEEMDRRMQKYNGYLTKQSRPRSWMNGKPQIKGVVVKLKIRKPKKPNSANRKCCIVRLSNGKKVIAFIPGEGHNLTEHSVVLVDGHRKKDLVSVHYSVIRGALDCAHVVKKSPDGA